MCCSCGRKLWRMCTPLARNSTRPWCTTSARLTHCSTRRRRLCWSRCWATCRPRYTHTCENAIHATPLVDQPKHHIQTSRHRQFVLNDHNSRISNNIFWCTLKYCIRSIEVLALLHLFAKHQWGKLVAISSVKHVWVCDWVYEENATRKHVLSSLIARSKELGPEQSSRAERLCRIRETFFHRLRFNYRSFNYIILLCPPLLLVSYCRIGATYCLTPHTRITVMDWNKPWFAFSFALEIWFKFAT